MSSYLIFQMQNSYFTKQLFQKDQRQSGSGIAGIPALFSVIDDGFIQLRFSVAKGKIPRFKVLSCHQRAFRIGKRQPLHCFLRNADGTTLAGGFPIDRLARSSRATSLDVCTRVVGCLSCGGAPNVHRCVQNQ
ncbi:Hypothetical_protein [Hexamita inflata]|uniref:Hypothetical_protein n=1 Tax=Hexamita inflata TaxID=28002 RepID=A0AA86NAG3_9EUKA|nr:Hypothetical protein HINF_LOCUS3365 [Hexamita inflata]